MIIRRAAVLALVLAVGTGCTGSPTGQGHAARPLPSRTPSAAPCTPRPGDGFPPLLTGFDDRLGTEPTAGPGSADVPDLKVTVLIQGACAAVTAGQWVRINYVGVTLRDGKVIDSSWSRKETFEAQVGQGELGREAMVIKGLDRGLVGVRVGSRVQLDIPPGMAYGDNPPSGFPQGPLRFVVDVLATRT